MKNAARLAGGVVLGGFLAAAPLAKPVCGKIAAMVSVDDFADRPPHVLADGETLTLGTHAVKWFDAPHLPHGWECGYIADPTTHTLFCGDLFACNGTAPTPLIETDILGPSEQFRAAMDPYAHAPNSRALLERLASSEPTTLALMHGSAWRGDGAALLRALAGRLTAKHPLAA
ncbi:MAG: hypothetical protein HY057_13840 [Rhodospirillales bacterium]|nr:hypothetical protein [Rhodospirillales bacterium]